MTKEVIFEVDKKYDWEPVLWDRVKAGSFMTSRLVHLHTESDENSVTMYMNDFSDAYPFQDPRALGEGQVMNGEDHNVDELVTEVCGTSVTWSAAKVLTGSHGGYTREDLKQEGSKLVIFPDEGASYTSVIKAGWLHSLCNDTPRGPANTMVVTYHPCRISTRPIPKPAEMEESFALKNETVNVEGMGRIYWYDYKKWRFIFYDLDACANTEARGIVSNSVETWCFGIDGEYQFWFEPEKPLFQQEKYKLHGMSGIRIGAGQKYSGKKFGPAHGVFAQFYDDPAAVRDDPMFLKTLFGAD